MKKHILAVAVAGLMSSGAFAVTCTDALLTPQKYSKIKMGKTPTEISGALGCEGSQSGTRTDPLGRSIVAYTWASDHKFITVEFMEKMGTRSIGKTGDVSFALPTPDNSPEIVWDNETGVLSLPVLSINTGLNAIGGSQMYYDVKLLLGSSGTWSLLSFEEQIPAHADAPKDIYVPAWKQKGSATATFNTQTNTLHLPRMEPTVGTAKQNMVILLSPETAWQVLSVTENGVTTNTPVNTVWTSETSTVVNYLGGSGGTVLTLANGQKYQLGEECAWSAPSGNTWANQGTGGSLSSSGAVAAGSVEIGKTASFNVTLTAGAEAVSLKKMVSSAGFEIINGCNEVIPAGGSCNVQVMFKPAIAASYSGNLIIDSNASSGRLSVPLSGTGTSTVNASAPAGNTISNLYKNDGYAAVAGSGGTLQNSTAGTTLALGSVEIGKAAGGTALLYNSSGTTAVEIQKIESSPGFSLQNLCGSVIAPGSTCGVTVNFIPTVATQYNGQLNVYTNASNGAILSVPLTGLGTLASNGGSATGYSEWNWKGDGVGAYGAAPAVDPTVEVIPSVPTVTVFTYNDPVNANPLVGGTLTQLMSIEGSVKTCPVTKF